MRDQEVYMNYDRGLHKLLRSHSCRFLHNSWTTTAMASPRKQLPVDVSDKALCMER